MVNGLEEIYDLSLVQGIGNPLKIEKRMLYQIGRLLGGKSEVGMEMQRLLLQVLTRLELEEAIF